MSKHKYSDFLVVVASGAQARFFHYLPAERRLLEGECMSNAIALAREGELISDRPGSHRDAGGSGRHGVTQTHAKDHNVRSFAANVGAKIDAQTASGEIQRIVLVAAPRFLGYLRKSLSPLSLSRCAIQVGKDLTRLAADEILVEIAEDLSQFSLNGGSGQ